MLRRSLAVLLLCNAGIAAAKAPLDGIARAYVALSLEAGTHEPEYVDAYIGPPGPAAVAKAHPRSIAQLRAAATSLATRARAVDPARLTPIERRRRTFLIAQLVAAETRLAMVAGVKFSFADEAKGLFGVDPQLMPLTSFDPVLAEIDRLVPGPDALADRVSDYRERFRIPDNRLETVMRTAIAECRRRTLDHIKLPADEHFTLEIVKDKPWGGYNYYKGADTSLVQINTDLPVLIDRAVDLGCHEGYPGHHVQGVLHEAELMKKRGWVEFTVQPLFSPLSVMGEGAGNYGIELAFPGDDRTAFAARTLFPLAGLDPAEAPRLEALLKALQALSGSRMTIAREYLDGHIDRETAIALAQKYGLTSRARAEKSIEFDDHYRSYVINYGLGRDMVAAAVERAGPGAAARWKKFYTLLAEPTVPADLQQP